MKLTLMGWIVLMSFTIAALLLTKHPGFAIKFANLLFYGLVVLIGISIFKYED